MTKSGISLILLLLSVMLLVAVGVSGCSKVEAGHVGVKVYLLGKDKGVDSEVLGVGRYWIGWNEELYLFPTYQQTTSWTARGKDESITFQTKEGLSVNADVGISYQISPDKVAILFQKYRKGVDEITNIYLKAIVRDAFVQVSSTKTIESIYGEGKSELVKEVKEMVAAKMEPIGINIDYVSIIGDLRLPSNVIASINAKIEATQRAQQRENELREAQAQAEKDVAIAEGQKKAAIAKAQGEAEATKVKAAAQAEANKVLAASITPELVRYLSVQTWDGKLPTVSGGSNVPFIQIPTTGAR